MRALVADCHMLALRVTGYHIGRAPRSLCRAGPAATAAASAFTSDRNVPMAVADSSAIVSLDVTTGPS